MTLTDIKKLGADAGILYMNEMFNIRFLRRNQCFN